MFAETAYAKVNLALHVRARRPDGYHALETVFAFCKEGDLLEAEPAEALSLEIVGPFAAGLSAGEDNLVMRAARLLGGRGARLRLTKQLPIASGIGGGSADAAAALRLLSHLWDVPLPPLTEQRSLGADVPACVVSQTARGTGVGEALAPEASVAGTPILLVNPLRPLSTAAVFAAWDGVDRGPLGDWHSGRNDLQPAASALVPEIEVILSHLSKAPGTTIARMSGSGATCFALFARAAERDACAASLPKGWWHLATNLR